MQLRNRVAHLIRTGHFKGGEQLPSVRSLAADARINYNTVTKAYRDLELAGLIVSVRGRGMYVQKDLPNHGEPSRAAADEALGECIQQYRNLGMTLDEIDAHVLSVTASLRTQAQSARERMASYDFD